MCACVCAYAAQQHLQQEIDFILLNEGLLLISQLPRPWELGAKRRDQLAHAWTIALCR